MLSVHKSKDAAWRIPFLNVVEGGSDVDNDDAVHKAFEKALSFARSKDIPHSHRGEPHAKRYLRTLKETGVPIIPRYVRIFCAEHLGLECEESAPDYGFKKLEPEPVRAELSFSGRKTIHAPRMNMSFVR